MTRFRVLSTLHVRVPALFLGLLAVVGAVSYLWLHHKVLAPPPMDPAEKHWYDALAAAEIDSVARLGAMTTADVALPVARWRELALGYGATAERYSAEILFLSAATGEALAGSGREDSLMVAVNEVDTELLQAMAAPGWDFDTVYPEPSNIDAYVNRIFHVAPVAGPDGETVGYLAGSWRPLVFAADEVIIDPRRLWLQTILFGLGGAFVVGWVAMIWLTRRIHRLRAGAAALAAGHLDHRVHDQSADELGQLGRAFNRMAARLEALVAELRNKEQFQRQLIANISHDLRTPMASLRGYIETLSLRGELMEPAEYQRYLRIIDDNLSHLDRLVDHLLQLSRLDAGQARFNLEEFPLPELVEGVLSRCEAPALARGIRLRCEHPDDLPLVTADPLQIAQVLQNLVENGIKFGIEGGEVRVESHRGEDGTVSVLVRDDGPGIAADDMPHIFERFFTGDRSRSRKGQSSGLGLAIAAKIVEGHGSRLTVSSELGKGACFRFALTAAPSLKADAASE